MAQVQRNKRTGRRQYTATDRRIRATLKRRQDPCGICGQPIDYTLTNPHDPGYFQVDHIIPVDGHGGETTLENSQASHRRCNRAKSNRVAGEVPRPPAPPEPCNRCNQIHRYPPGVTFITCRTWSAGHAASYGTTT